jgi:hypothetical protein
MEFVFPAGLSSPDTSRTQAGLESGSVPDWESSFILRLSRYQAVLLKRRQFDDVNTHCCQSVGQVQACLPDGLIPPPAVTLVREPGAPRAYIRVKIVMG